MVQTVSSAALLLLLVLVSISGVFGQQLAEYPCDKPRNAALPFCDPSLPIDARVQDLVSRLTLDEKIGLLVHESKGASQNVDLDEYNWWNEALHGVADSPGVIFRPPTEFATVFPQIINLAASFNRDIFFQVGNATGNEARAFANVGNAGLTYWSPNINIYRDPRWGRGHETPGEDPHLSAEFARQFIRGLQGDREEGFLKTSACCKHFAAHSVEEERYSFDAIVTPQDMADTYLPVFKSCVEESGVSCVMCAYSAINGVPACADKPMLTDMLRGRWGFDGYVVSDCWAVQDIYTSHHYTNSTGETCRVALDAGLDMECGGFFTLHLRRAVDDGYVSEAMLDAALHRAFRVLMRLGYFEPEATRPFKELLPSMVDSIPHQALALEAGRQSIVLLKNIPNAAREGATPLPLEAAQFKSGSRATMVVIGPYSNSTVEFLANYHGHPSFIKVPIDEIRRHVPDVGWEWGCDLVSPEGARLQEAEDLAREASQVVLFVGIDTERVEHETADRKNLTLPGLQNELISRVLGAAQAPIILVLVSGGAIDCSAWEVDPRVGALIWAGYLGQSAGEAIAEVIFGVSNPSGRLPQTFYTNEFTESVAMSDMNMRPTEGVSLGRGYRFYTGQAVYPFGHGLSYTTFEYSLPVTSSTPPPTFHSNAIYAEDCAITMTLTVRNTGPRAGDHSVLWFISPPAAGEGGRPLKILFDFAKFTRVQVLESREVQICLNRKQFQLADEVGNWAVVPGEWKLTVGQLERTILVI